MNMHGGYLTCPRCRGLDSYCSVYAVFGDGLWCTVCSTWDAPVAMSLKFDYGSCQLEVVPWQR
jgi:hypothetical protein